MLTPRQALRAVAFPTAVRWVAGIGVDGIFCGEMGEFWSMSIDERHRVHEIVD